MPDVSEAGVVARAQMGEAEAVSLLYEAHQPAIFRYVWSRLQERRAAEDLTGEVFLRMLEALPRYRSSTTPFRAWLYRIARNLIIDWGRRNRHDRLATPEETQADPAPDSDLEHKVEARLSLEALRAALMQLEASQREVVTLRFLAGFSLHETAAAVNKTEAAVKALQHRGLAVLSQILNQEQVVS